MGNQSSTPRLTACLTEPLAASTRPGTPTPTTPSRASPRRARSSSTTLAAAATTSSPPVGVVTRTSASTTPSEVAATPWVLVAPMSSPTLALSPVIGPSPPSAGSPRPPRPPAVSCRGCRSGPHRRCGVRASPTRRRRHCPSSVASIARTSGRRWASRTCTTSGPSGSGSPGSTTRSGWRPHGPSPTAMLAGVSMLTTRAPVRSGSSPSRVSAPWAAAAPLVEEVALATAPSLVEEVALATAPSLVEEVALATVTRPRNPRTTSTRRTASARRSSLSRPDRTASTIARWISRTSDSSLSGPMHRRSAPALRARRAAVGIPRPADAPAMSRASLTMAPSKPSSSRSAVRIVALRVAGRSGSSAGTEMWEVITAATPAPTAAANGGRSRDRTTSAGSSSTGRVR